MEKMKLCLILNGPPGCGKDTIAELLVEYGFSKEQFKDQLYIETADHFDVPLDALIERATDRELKETNWALTGMTPRNMLIETSEKHIKPRYGDDYFGKAAAKRCVKSGKQLVVFSDGGFQEEVRPLSDSFEHVVIFRMHRKDYTFNNDSRSYLYDFPHCVDVMLHEGKPELAVTTILDVCEELL